MQIPETSIVRSTWWALLHPKRLAPILVVIIPMLVAQESWSIDRLALPLAAALCFTFVAAAPVTYRFLFPDGLDLSHGAIRVVIYAAVGAGMVLSVSAGVPKLLGMRETFLTDRMSIAVEIALFLVGGWGLGRDIGFEQRERRLRAEAESAQLMALRAHLDPHFIFNTLNAIAEWCRIDGVVAEKAILKLSSMLRVLLSGVKETRWPLSQELELTQMLFDLHLMRDTGLFTVTFDTSQAKADTRVPPMIMLTLAENAVKHGPQRGHRGEIQCSVRDDENGTHIVIENPGPYTGTRAGSIGLPSFLKQLELTYRGRARFTIDSVGENRTRAEVFLPTHTSLGA